MSYFYRSIQRFLTDLTTPKRTALRDRCLAQHARGVVLAGVPASALGATFTPEACAEPGYVFVTYEQLITTALADPSALDATTRAHVQKALAEYDPQTELVWLFATTGCPRSELCLIKSTVAAEQ